MSRTLPRAIRESPASFVSTTACSAIHGASVGRDKDIILIDGTAKDHIFRKDDRAPPGSAPPLRRKRVTSSGGPWLAGGLPHRLRAPGGREPEAPLSPAELEGEQPVVDPPVREELPVGAGLPDLPPVHHDDPVRRENGGEPVGDHEGGPAGQKGHKGGLDLVLVHPLHAGGRLVQ